MERFRLDRRTLVRGLAGLGGVGALSGEATASDGFAREPQTDPHTRVTFMAVVEAVIPPTPDLRDRHGDSLGSRHGPGGLEAGLHDFFVWYLNTGFSAAVPRTRPVGNVRLAEAVADALDEAAAELVARGGNEHPPAGRRVRELVDEGTNGDATVEEAVLAAAAGPFARLHPEDRLRAVALFDEDDKEFDTAGAPGPLVEGDAGLVANLVVGFAELIYYSEWGGYVEGSGLRAAPSGREHHNDPAEVQSWRQTGYPGIANGYAALRGYAGKADAALGEGRTWKTVTVTEGDVEEEDGHDERRSGTWEGGVHLHVTVDDLEDPYADTQYESEDQGALQVTFESGEFEDNDYTDDPGYENYTEVFREDGTRVGGSSEIDADDAGDAADDRQEVG